MESMESKDNRSKQKRIKMKQHRKGGPPPPALASSQRMKHASNDTSSSYQMEAMRGVIDVADSSDEQQRYAVRPITRFIAPMPLRELDELGMNDKELEENPQLNAGDFNIMSQAPASVGGHFQFSSERNWDTDETLLLNTEASEYFTLNLKLLNVGLQSIPFYKRMDYSTSMFSRDQLLAMDQAAESYEKQYQNVLKEHQSNPKIKIKSGKRTGSAKSQRSSKVETNPEQDDELDELLSMTAGKTLSKLSLETRENKLSEAADENIGKESAPSDTIPTIEGGNKEDIQQWLDNVLDE